MARYPGAEWRPLGEQTEPRMTRPDIVCLHTMVGYLSSTDTMFKRKGYTGTESHFGVGGKWGRSDIAHKLDGVVYQWQDTSRQADANGMGNDRLISIETADNAPDFPRDLEPWTPRQLDALVKLVAWCCRTHDIPPVLIPDSRPGRRGIGYHKQGCDPWRVEGGELWSSAYAKECPGPARIEQVKTIIVPRVAAALAPAGGGGTDESEDDMALSDQDVERVATRVTEKLLNTKTEVFRDGNQDGRRDEYTVRQCLAATPISQTAVERIDALRAELVAEGVIGDGPDRENGPAL